MTTLTGLIGDPIAHSLSPAIHAYWAGLHGVDTDYKLFTTKASRLRQTMLHMRKKNVRGVNITIPHKQSVMEYLDAIDDTAKKIGAVNTVVAKDGTFTGTNTDAYGFITNLRVGLTGKEDGDVASYLTHVVLLGAGGATRAAVTALKEAGAQKITVTNRTASSAERIARDFGVENAPWEARNSLIGSASLLVNTTSLGMHGHPKLELDLRQLPEGCAVYDIVYAPRDTGLIAYARQRHLPTVEGLGMLIYQAQAAFHAWHGVHPAVTPELYAALEAMGEPA